MIDDAYLAWFDIRDPVRPPDHYHLLGLPRFENHADLIRAAAIERACRAWSKRRGRSGRRTTRRLLREIAAAYWVLSRRGEKALYDHGLRGIQEPETEDLSPEERFRRAAMLESLFAPPCEHRKAALVRQGEGMGVGPHRIRAVLEQLRDVRPRFDSQTAEDELRELADLPERRRAHHWLIPAAVAAVALVVVAILIERFLSAGRPDAGPAGGPEAPAVAAAPESESKPAPPPPEKPAEKKEPPPPEPRGADPNARVEEVLGERAAAALAELRSEVERLRSEDRIDEILPALDRFPQDLRTAEAAAEIERIRGETRGWLESELAEILRRGRALADEGKFAEALECLERPRRWGLPDLAAPVEVEIASVLEKQRLRERPPTAPPAPTPEEILEGAFGEALARVAATPTRGDDVALAREMLDRAASEGDPAVAGLIIERAAGLADATPLGLEVSIRAEELRARKLGLDPTQALAEIVQLRERLSTSVLLSRQDREIRTEELLDDLAELARRRIEQGRYGDAAEAFRSSTRAAKRNHDDRWMRYAEAREREILPWAEAEKELVLARRALGARSSDQAANRKVGRYLLLLAGDAAAAEPYLTAGRDRRLLSLIEVSRRLADPPDQEDLLQFARLCMDTRSAVTDDLQRLALIAEAEEAWRAVLGPLSPIDELRHNLSNLIAQADADAQKIAKIDPALPEAWLALWTAVDGAPHLGELVLREQRHDGAIWRRMPEDLYYARQFARRKIVIATHPPRRDAPMRFIGRKGLTARTSVLYIGVRARDPAGSVEIRVQIDDREIERRSVAGQWVDLRVDLGDWKGGTHVVTVACYPDDWRDETVLWDYVGFAPPGP